MHSKKQWAEYHDNRLLKLAMYHLSEGLTLPVTDKDKLYDKFSEFKRLVTRGSFTVKQLEDSVYGKFGIMPQKDETHDFLQALSKLARKEPFSDPEPEPEEEE